MYQPDSLFKNLTISKKYLAMHMPYSVCAYHCNGQNYTNGLTAGGFQIKRL